MGTYPDMPPVAVLRELAGRMLRNDVTEGRARADLGPVADPKVPMTGRDAFRAVRRWVQVFARSDSPRINKKLRADITEFLVTYGGGTGRTASAPARVQRIAYLTSEEDRAVKDAAKLAGMSVTRFVRNAALEAAQRVADAKRG